MLLPAFIRATVARTVRDFAAHDVVASAQLRVHAPDPVATSGAVSTLTAMVRWWTVGSLHGYE